MLTNIELGNFKCLERTSLDLSPITLLIGLNGSGKSSVLHTLIFLKKFILQPATFNLENMGDLTFYDYLNLGNFDEIVYLHKSDKPIMIAAQFKGQKSISKLRLILNKPPKHSQSTISWYEPIKLSFSVGFNGFPYQGNQVVSGNVNFDNLTHTVQWNGLNASVTSGSKASELNSRLNEYRQILSGLFLFHLRQTFRNVTYSTISTIDCSKPIITENEVIGYLSQPLPLTDDLIEKLSYYLHNTIGEEAEFRVYGTTVRPTLKLRGIGRFALSTEGLGSNRLAYMLMTLLIPYVKTLLIEEPETHLHPKVIYDVGNIIANTVKNENKQVIVTTHSEHFLFSLLSCVGEGLLTPKDLTIYCFKKEESKSQIKKLKITEDGQVEGGLPEFFESDWETFEKYMKALGKT